MNRHTQNILYHLLPVVYWLLAIGGSVIPVIVLTHSDRGSNGLVPYIYGFAVALLVLLCMHILHRIQRHASSVEQCFQVALLLGFASLGLPSVVFLIVPMWAYLIYRNLFSFRSFLASLLGFATIAILFTALYFQPFFTIHSSLFTLHFSLSYNLLAWLPASLTVLAYLASSITRYTLHIR